MSEERIKYRDDKKKSNAKGLQIEINPVLLSSNLNLIREQHKNSNPYLSTLNQYPGPNYKQVNRRYEKGFHFYEKGEITSEYERERELQRQELAKQEFESQQRKEAEEREAEERRLKIERGELPDTTIGEEKSLPEIERIPIIEWWDKMYVDEELNVVSKYTTTYKEDEESDEDEDEEDIHPSIRYINHPVPIEIGNEVIIPRVYLTKKEQKKVRRNRRKIQREERETNIKLGLMSKPEPKVKLSNMMNVYENNQNITDPTAWEQTVKTQVIERKRIHEDENEKRHQEAAKRKKEIATDNNKAGLNEKQDNYCKVFWFKSLINPKIRYKMNMNSKQLSLRGLCLRVNDEGSGIIVICGTEKSCKFYDKLITKRIKWDENFTDRNKDDEEITMEGNYVEKVWEGILNEVKFPNWFMRVCNDSDEVRQILMKFEAKQFYRFMIDKK